MPGPKNEHKEDYGNCRWCKSPLVRVPGNTKVDSTVCNNWKCQHYRENQGFIKVKRTMGELQELLQ